MSIAMKLLQWHIYLYVYNPNNVCPHSFSPGQTTEKVSLAQGLANRKTDHSVSYLKAKPKSEARTLAVQHGHRVALGFQSSKQKDSQEHRRRLFSTVIAARTDYITSQSSTGSRSSQEKPQHITPQSKGQSGATAPAVQHGHCSTTPAPR